jgi:hypothetical protein
MRTWHGITSNHTNECGDGSLENHPAIVLIVIARSRLTVRHAFGEDVVIFWTIR